MLWVDAGTRTNSMWKVENWKWDKDCPTFFQILHFYSKNLCFLFQIGLMRGGTLLAEESPSQLMTRYNCNNLEQAFLELSKKQSIASGTQDESLDMVDTYPSEEDKKSVVTPLQSNKFISKARITAQLVKNYYWMKRNKPWVQKKKMLDLSPKFHQNEPSALFWVSSTVYTELLPSNKLFLFQNNVFPPSLAPRPMRPVLYLHGPWPAGTKASRGQPWVSRRTGEVSWVPDEWL